MVFVELFGWLGMGMLLGTFFAASTKRLSDRSYLFHTLNFLGAMGVLLSAYFKGVWASVAMEITWGTIALIGLWNIYRSIRRKHALE